MTNECLVWCKLWIWVTILQGYYAAKLIEGRMGNNARQETAGPIEYL